MADNIKDEGERRVIDDNVGLEGGNGRQVIGELQEEENPYEEEIF
jgi:hypothetical protein